MVDDDVLYRFRLRLFSLAAELGNVREACRIFGVHHSTYYRWRAPVLRWGLAMLRPRERRPPRMPNQTSQPVEQRIVAFSLGHPGLGPRRISATLAQERWGGIGISPNGVWRVLLRHGLSRRISRLSPRGRLCGATGSRAPRRSMSATSRWTTPASSWASTASCGPAAGTSGRIWRYTAIDLASSYVWAELPRRRSTVRPAHQPAGEAGRRGPAAAWLGSRARAHRQRHASSAPRSSAIPSVTRVPSRRSSGPVGR